MRLISRSIASVATMFPWRSDSNTIFIPLVVLLFAGLYKMAYLTAKDSNLAI